MKLNDYYIEVSIQQILMIDYNKYFFKKVLYNKNNLNFNDLILKNVIIILSFNINIIFKTLLKDNNLQYSEKNYTLR